ncbi:DUF6703 family protein [Actinoplanes sp. GCM10030250]|uniref:DUF6703 family protein n=1 Tax=Actinoplanes sp. GCM10030250 TaxID=3273376 RepID=UPI003619DA2D
MTPSDHLLRRLAGVNPTAAFLGALVLFLAGLFLPGIIGALLLGVLTAGLGALTFTTWPVQTPATKVVRLIMLSLLLAAVVSKAL